VDLSKLRGRNSIKKTLAKYILCFSNPRATWENVENSTQFTMAPRILFGTGSGLVPASSPSEIKSLLEHFKELQIPIYGIDTAAIYPSGDVGKSEQLLGEADIGSSGFVLDSKVLASIQDDRRDKGGPLSRDNILWSSKESLRRLKVPKVRTLYAHSPDTSTPIAETVEAFGEVLKTGEAETVSEHTSVSLR
jgi:aryl-alcohol dehydrogenase-like predicted oxidoreductase